MLVWFILLAAWLRAKGLFDNSFHIDEALFASWARLISTGRDPFLQTQLVDKPPLLFYLQAVAFRFLRPSEWAARLPNWIGSLVLLPLVYHWVQRAWRDRLAGLIAALLLALSPFAIQFSSSAFTDFLMLVLVIAALAQRKSRIAGGLFGLALAVKYQALLLLPLFLRKRVAWQIAILMLGCVAVWMFASGQTFGGTGDALLIRGIRPISSYELRPRWQQWQTYLATVFNLPILLLMLPSTVWLFMMPDRNRTIRTQDRLLWLMLLSYFCFHWLLATAVYDRYMLPFAVLVIVLVSRVLASIIRQLVASPPREQLVRVLAVCSLFFCTLWLSVAAIDARDGRFLVGGRPNADEGAAAVGVFFADAPYGTVLYDHWYSWQWRFHLMETGVYTEWTPDPATLVDNLDVFYDERRYIVLPADARAAPFQRALMSGGYQLEKRLQSNGILLYQIMR